MTRATPRRRSHLAAIVPALALGLLAGLAAAPALAQDFTITTIADKKLAALPAGPLFWRVETYAALAAARAAEGPTSMAAEVAGKVWLFTLGPKGGSTPGGAMVAEVGPVPPIQAKTYMIRLTNSGGPPGAKTAVHSHPGAEAFYVVSGRMGQKTPHGVTYTEAGQGRNGQGADLTMEVFNAGPARLDQLVMFLVDADRPFTAPAKFD